MPIVVTLDALLARRGMKAKELARIIGVSETHLSQFRSGKVRGVRFGTLAKLCLALDCTPAELLGYERDEADFAAPDPDGD